MKLDGKVKGGLAWAGLFVVLAVPAADLLFPAADANANLVTTSDTKAVVPATEAAVPVRPVSRPTVLQVPSAAAPAADPIETASVPAGADPVENFVNSGKPLPDYISDADRVATRPVATVPAVTAPAVAAPATPTLPSAAQVPAAQVASIPAEAAPVPRPRSARPAVQAVAALPPAEQPLILDEAAVQRRETTASRVEPFPLSDDGEDIVVTGDQLEEWDSGSLADYLARRGLLSGSGDTAGNAASNSGSSAGQGEFVFNEGPSRPRRFREDLGFFLF